LIIYLIKDKLDIKKISILDPLLNIYIKHPNHHYQHSWIIHSVPIQEMSQNVYNADHPIRMETCFLNKQLESFPMLFRKEIKTTCAGRDAFEIYYIGKKK